MAWEFFHSLVLQVRPPSPRPCLRPPPHGSLHATFSPPQFLAEELSQYPFWAAKVALATADTSTLAVGPLGPFAALWGLLSTRFQAGGLLALYHGCVPYAVAAYMYHIDHVEVLMRRYVRDGAFMRCLHCCLLPSPPQTSPRGLPTVPLLPIPRHRPVSPHSRALRRASRQVPARGGVTPPAVAVGRRAVQPAAGAAQHDPPSPPPYPTCVLTHPLIPTL